MLQNDVGAVPEVMCWLPMRNPPWAVVGATFSRQRCRQRLPTHRDLQRAGGVATAEPPFSARGRI